MKTSRTVSKMDDIAGVVAGSFDDKIDDMAAVVAGVYDDYG